MMQYYTIPADTAGAWQTQDDAGLAGVVDKILHDVRRIVKAAGHVEHHAFSLMRKSIKIAVFNPGYGKAAAAATEAEKLICDKYPQFRKAAQIMRGHGVSHEIGRTEGGFTADKAATACFTMFRGRPVVDTAAVAAVQHLWKSQNWDQLFPGQFVFAREKRENTPMTRTELTKALQRIVKAAEKRGLDTSDEELLRQTMEALQHIIGILN